MAPSLLRLKGLIRPLKSLIKPFKGLLRPLKGLIRPLLFPSGRPDGRLGDLWGPLGRQDGPKRLARALQIRKRDFSKSGFRIGVFAFPGSKASQKGPKRHRGLQRARARASQSKPEPELA